MSCVVVVVVVVVVLVIVVGGGGGGCQGDGQGVGVDAKRITHKVLCERATIRERQRGPALDRRTAQVEQGVAATVVGSGAPDAHRVRAHPHRHAARPHNKAARRG